MPVQLGTNVECVKGFLLNSGIYCSALEHTKVVCHLHPKRGLPPRYRQEIDHVRMVNSPGPSRPDRRTGRDRTGSEKGRFITGRRSEDRSVTRHREAVRSPGGHRSDGSSHNLQV